MGKKREKNYFNENKTKKVKEKNDNKSRKKAP